jgi:DNA-binding transcriptional regulator YiaG
MDIPALPFCHLTLTGQRPTPPAYPKELNTLGGWIRKTRIDQNLTQSQVGQIIGVSECCITNWELGHAKPEVRYIPHIIAFIGYCPYNTAGDLIDRIRDIRHAFGLTQEQMSKLLKVDESSLASWECREHKPVKKSQDILRKFLAALHH